MVGKSRDDKSIVNKKLNSGTRFKVIRHKAKLDKICKVKCQIPTIKSVRYMLHLHPAFRGFNELSFSERFRQQNPRFFVQKERLESRLQLPRL